MRVELEFVDNSIKSMFRRRATAEAVGGVTHHDKIEGAKVPDDWKLDIFTNYWLPPNVDLI